MGEKRKIEMKKRETRAQRMVAFSKRRKGLFKKAYELHCLTGANTAVLAFSQAGRPYLYGDPSFHSTLHQYFLQFNNTFTQETKAEEEEEEEVLDCFFNQQSELRAWLDGIQVDECDDFDQLVCLKNELEIVKHNLVQDEFVRSLLA